MNNPLSVTTSRGGIWQVTHGRKFFIVSYAHAQHGSVIQRTFVGPYSFRRAVRWVKKVEW